MREEHGINDAPHADGLRRRVVPARDTISVSDMNGIGVTTVPDASLI